jgi:hypothetical protein
LAEVEATSPYNTNNQTIVKNDEDQLYLLAKAGGDDPLLKISLIGNTIEDGLYATMDVGVNPKAVQNPKAGFAWTENGGVLIEDSPWAGYPESCEYCAEDEPGLPTSTAA